MIEANEPKPFEVWPENWKVVEIFMRMQTQWKVDTMGGVYLGLDYSALPLIFKLFSVDDEKDAFESIQIMEIAALETLNEKAG